MTHDEIEFLISQHFDGTLDADEAAKLRAALDADPSVQLLFKEHDRLDQTLKASKPDLQIDQEWLNAQIAGKIDEARSRPMRISHWTVFAPMAIAATLLIGLTLGVLFLRDDSDAPINPTIAKSIHISLPEPSKNVNTSVANVSVGIPANMTPAMMTTLFLAEHRSSGRIVIQPAGEVRHGPFD